MIKGILKNFVSGKCESTHIKRQIKEVAVFLKKNISNNLHLDIAFRCKGAENRKIWKDIKTQIFRKKYFVSSGEKQKRFSQINRKKQKRTSYIRF